MNKKICIIGLGYVGLPLAHAFSKKYSVVGFDINKPRVDELNSGFDRTLELTETEVKESIENGMVYSTAGERKFIMMIPKRKRMTKSELLNTWSHELYHIARNSFGVMNREYFYLEDILVEYMEKSLPILKELIWKRRNM